MCEDRIGRSSLSLQIGPAGRFVPSSGPADLPSPSPPSGGGSETAASGQAEKDAFPLELSAPSSIICRSDPILPQGTGLFQTFFGRCPPPLPCLPDGQRCCLFQKLMLQMNSKNRAEAAEEDEMVEVNVSDEEMDKIIEEAREELIESGENPDECFRSVQSTRYMM